MAFPQLHCSSVSLAEHIIAARWGGAAHLEHDGAAIEELFGLGEDAFLAVVALNAGAGPPMRYLLGLVASDSRDDAICLATETGAAYYREALGEGAFVQRLLRALSPGSLQGRSGRLEFFVDDAVRQAVCGESGAEPIKGEQSNTSLLLSGQWLVKFYRRFSQGIQPDIEIGEYLTSCDFEHIPRVVGSLRYVSAGGVCSVALVQQYLPMSVDGWKLLTGNLRDALDRSGESSDSSLDLVEALGVATARLHTVMARAEGDLGAVPVNAADYLQWKQGLTAQWRQTQSTLGTAIRLPLNEGQFHSISGRWDCLEVEGRRIRCHGDFHLGQTLWQAGKWYLIDFEGEPTKPLEQRREKHSPLRDVAGMLRSLSYAVWNVLLEREAGADKKAESLLQWEGRARERFLQTYKAHTRTRGLYPRGAEDFERVLALFELEKALYELDYEARHRPDWVRVPLEGARRIAQRFK